MASRITATTFHATPDIDRGIRREARRILKPLYTTTAYTLPNLLPPQPSMIVTVGCNDTPGTRDAGVWQQTIARYAEDYPAARSNDLVNACVFWSGPNAVKPPLERLARAGRILMIAAEFDTLTPIPGALRMINTLPNASLLVLRGNEQHGVFTMTDEACVERTGARFLLDGRVPTEQLTECQVDAGRAPPNVAVDASGFNDAPRVRAWRKRLSRLVGQRPRILPTPRSLAD